MRTAIVLLTWFICASSVSAQTVGNGSSIAPSAGQRESYGINVTQSDGAQTAFSTRHYNRGNDSGIGGSFIGTSSPTSESSPALPAPAPIQTSPMQFRLPKLESAFSQATTNPALQPFTPALPSLPRSTALTGPLTRPLWQSGIENLPSFNKQPSLLDKMQFGNFDSFGK